jgi:hypothetical protein
LAGGGGFAVKSGGEALGRRFGFMPASARVEHSLQVNQDFDGLLILYARSRELRRKNNFDLIAINLPCVLER